MALLVIDVERRFAGGPSLEARLELPLADPDVTVLFGPSGAGKTTLLRLIAGLEAADAGVIRCAGEVWCDVAAGVHLRPQRRRAGMCFQDHALFPHLDVAGNIGFGLGALAPPARRERVAEMVARLGLGGLEHRMSATLSGGERQRVALARALAPRPALLLLDEPLAGIDAPERARLRADLRRFLRSIEVPAIVVTHDRTEALVLGDRLAVLAAGRIRQVGPVADVFARPADVEVARVVGVETVVAGTVVDRAAGEVVVEAGGRRLVAAGEASGDVHVCIRAEEVILERGPAPADSARNRLAGPVLSADDEGPLVRVVIDAGFPLAALVTRRSAARLDLRPGEEVTAVVKAQAVHLVERV